MINDIAIATERLYEAFGELPQPKKIDGCPCCTSDAELCALLETPLRALSPEQLSSYSCSALLTAGSEQDFRYLLPRILEISIHDPDWWPSREVVLSKLTLAGWDTWPNTQRNAIVDVVFSAFVADAHAGVESAWNIDAWLCGLALAKVDLKAFLDHLSQAQNEELVFSLYELNSAHLLKGKLSNSFWSDHRELQSAIVAWFRSDTIQEVITRFQKMRYGVP